MQVGLGHVEFVPACEPIEDRYVHRKKGAEGRPRAAEVVRFGDADLQIGFGNVRVQRNLRIVLGADLQNPCSLAWTLASFATRSGRWHKAFVISSPTESSV